MTFAEKEEARREKARLKREKKERIRKKKEEEAKRALEAAEALDAEGEVRSGCCTTTETQLFVSALLQHSFP